MKSLLLAACSLAAIAFADAATADPQTDEANRQRQMATMRAEAARNDQNSANRSLAQQQATAAAARDRPNSGSSSVGSPSTTSTGFGASGGSYDTGPQSVVDSYTITVRIEETPQQMLARLERDAAQGDTAAQYNLGRIYYTGFNDAPRDDVRARSYFRQAAEAGHAASQANYGYFLSEGIGGPANAAEGVRWLRTSAEAGNSFGQAQYGMSLVTTDAAQAAGLLIPAADAGEVTAQAMLGTLFAMGEGVTQDDARAVRYLRAASDQGEAGSTGLLAGMYLSGRGGTQAEGYALLRQAAEAGDPNSQRNYGLVLVQGRGAPKDERAGAALIRLAAAGGHKEARTLLGHLYNEGLGVPQSDPDAIYWWTLAAEGGEPEAIDLMNQLRTAGDELGRPPTQGTGPVASDAGRSEGRDPPGRDAQAATAPRVMQDAAGSTIRGELTTADSRLADDSFYDCHSVRTMSGVHYRAVMRSTTFDTYLAAGTGDCAGTPTLTDDDGAGGTDSAISFVGDGETWYVRANSLEASTTGPYTLEISEAGRTALLEVGRPLQGELTAQDPRLGDGSHFDCHAVQTSAGVAYRVTMGSRAFDTYLSAGRGQCAAEAEINDDDGGGGTDSALTLTGDGRIWFVRANSLEAGATGPYRLEVTSTGSGGR